MTSTTARHLFASCAVALLAALSVSPASAYDPDRGDDSYRPAYDEQDRGSTKDGYPVPQPPPSQQVPYHQSYKDDAPPPPPPTYRRESRCLDKFGIQRALHDQGWHEFDHVEINGDVAHMTARGEEGRRFDISIDSCTGQVIEAHPVVAYYDGSPPPPPAYFYTPRPAVGFYFGGGYRHWR